MVDSINKSSQAVLLQSILTSEIPHGQSATQVTQATSTNPTTSCLDGRCGTLTLPVVARALSSITSSMPFIFIPSVSGSKASVSVVHSPSVSTPTTHSQVSITVTSDVNTETTTVVSALSSTSQISPISSVDSVANSPGALRSATVLPIRPSPAKGGHRANFLPILPKFRTRRLPKTRSLRQSRRRRSPTPTDAEVREKVMAILERMKEIEAKQRKEKEEAIMARIGGIKRATKASRTTLGEPLEAPSLEENTLEFHEAAKIPRLEPISPASSAGETTSSQMADGNLTRTESAFMSEECVHRSTSPPHDKFAERTPSPSADQACFASTSLDQCLSARSQENTSRSTGSSSMGSSGTMVRRCTCSRTGCLKLYCDCFAAGQRCLDCCCFGCRNNGKYEELRQKAINRIVNRKPDAFLSKIEYSSENESIHTRGCNCKRSACLKNYCECYEARIRCTSRCRCQSCFNTEAWAAQALTNSQPKLTIRPRSVSNHTPNSGNLIPITMTTATLTATDGGRASASPSFSAPNDLDPLSAMLIDRSGSPGLTVSPVEVRGPITADKRTDSRVALSKDSEDRKISTTAVSVDSSCTSNSSTPPSSTSSIVLSPSFEVRSAVQSTVTPQLVPSTSSVPPCTLVSAVTGTNPIAPTPTPADRLWQVVSQATGTLPLSNPLVGLSMPATSTGLTPTGQLATNLTSLTVPQTAQSTVLGFPTDASNLLTTYLVALLSGQSQATLPTQPAPTFLNPTKIASVSPSTILLNCPTIPVPSTVLATTVTTATTTVAPINSTTSITTALRTGRATSEISPNLTVVSTPSTATVTSPEVGKTMNSGAGCIKLEPCTVTPSTSTDTSRLNGDEQYTAEELATFERLLQQRYRAAASSSGNAPHPVHQESRIKLEQSERLSDCRTVSQESPKPKKPQFSPLRRLNTEVASLRRQVFRLTQTVRSQDRSIRALQRTIHQLWMSDSTMAR